MESDQRSGFLVWSHFLRRTGVHFVGKSSVPTLTLGSLSDPDASARNPSILIVCVLDSRSFDDLRPGIKRSIQNTSFQRKLKWKQKATSKYALLSSDCVRLLLGGLEGRAAHQFLNVGSFPLELRKIFRLKLAFARNLNRHRIYELRIDQDFEVEVGP